MTVVNEATAVETARTVKGGAVVGPSSVRRSPSIGRLTAAMVKVQAEIDDPQKNKRADAGGRGSYRYADLPTVLDAVRPALSRHGLAVMQFPCELDGEPALTTLLTHGDGEWIETTVRLRPVKIDPQGIGSAQTYCRRYALLALCGVAADDDDDGRAASQPRPTQQARPEPAPAKNEPALRAQYAQRIGELKDRAGMDSLWSEYKAACGAGKLGRADEDELYGLFLEASRRFPKPQPAGAQP